MVDLLQMADAVRTCRSLALRWTLRLNRMRRASTASGRAYTSLPTRLASL